MSLRRLRTVLALSAVVCVGVPLSLSCGGDKRRPGVSATPSVAVEQVLAESRERFRDVRSYRLEYEVTQRGYDGKFAGEGGYESDETVYATGDIEGVAVGDDETDELLFLPPDLYVRQGSGDWLVLSPWNQGYRPEELDPLYLQDPFIDYIALMNGLTQIEQGADAELQGRATHTYEGMVSESVSDDLGPLFHSADATVDVSLWIDAESMLPARVVARVRRDRVDIRFLDYGETVAAPAPPDDARPFRDAQFPDADCIGEAYAQCLAAQEEISGSASCEGEGKRVCLVPLGQISADLVQHLVEQYAELYDVDVKVLAPTEIPESLADPLRQQIDASGLIDYMGSVFPEDYADPNVTLIGITIVDLYDATSHFRYLFGVKGSPSDPRAVVSNFRMNPETYGDAPDQQLLYERTRKLVFKYIALLHLGLEPSDDPTSPVYDSIGGPADLDAMSESLPVR